MTTVNDLYGQQGQSQSLDKNLVRELSDRREAPRSSWTRRCRGAWNPTIFRQGHRERRSFYNKQVRQAPRKDSIRECYWGLVVTDIVDALAVLQPVHDESDGIDGCVSLEVAPALAPPEQGPRSTTPRHREPPPGHAASLKAVALPPYDLNRLFSAPARPPSFSRSRQAPRASCHRHY